MRRLTAYYAFRIFFSVKSHFEGKYDLIKYKWHFMKPKEKNFYSWNGYGAFKLLAERKITSVNEWVNICITIFKETPSISYDQIIDEYEVWLDKSRKWLTHMSNIEYIFKAECKKIIQKMYVDDVVFSDEFGSWLMQQYFNQEMCLETFIIFRQILNLKLDGDPNYEYLYKDKYIWYERLIAVSHENYRDILKDIIINEKQRRSIM